jgi:chaperonin cofactor prefoldin
LLGLERIYARPDPQIETLTEQIQQQTSRLEALQAQLQTLLSQHSPEPEATDDDTDED